MPIYEYKCLNCGNQLEIMQKISDETLRECPRCQGKLEKQWSLSGFQFKGTGWYVSDYGKHGEAERKAESNAKKTVETGSEKSAENKSEKGADGNSNSAGSDAAKTSSTVESTAGTSSASKPENKPAESKPTAKTD
jgi:putative FmdB family regulatory protein